MELILDEFIDNKDGNPYYIYQICEENQEIGRIVFRLGSNTDHYYDGHIGYSIDPEYRGQAKSYQACLLLQDIIKQHGYSEVIITCSPDNLASKKIIQKLGAKYLETAVIPAKQRKYFARDEKTKEIYLWRVL